MTYFSVKGILAPVFTPISHGHLDLNVIPQYAKHLSENGVDGVLVGGTSGEAMSLNVEERKLLVDRWLDEARPLGLKVMMQVGGAPMPDVITLANHAQLVKADGILVLPELYFKPKTAEKLVDYLEAVSNAAPGLPLVYYHFPGMTGVDIDIIAFYKEASSRIPNFKGLKADMNVAVQLEELLAPDHRVFIANHLLVPAALMGHTSSIATVTNLFPSLVRDLVDSAMEDHVSKGIMRKQAKLNALVAAITHQGKWEFVPSMKAAMQLTTGIDAGDPRRPLTALNARQKEQMQTAVNEISGKK